PTAASSYPPPPPLPSAITHDKIPDYAHPDCFNYAGRRPVCYYCGAGGHTNLKCKVLVADYVANNMRPGFPPNIFQREGQRALDRIRNQVPRSHHPSNTRPRRDPPPPGGSSGSYNRSSSNHPSSGSHDSSNRPYYQDRGNGGRSKPSSNSDGNPPTSTTSTMAVYPARLPAYLPLPPPPKSSNSPPIFDADEYNPHWENAIPDSNLDPRWLEPSAKTHSRPTPPPRLPPKRMSEFEDTILQSKRSRLDHTEYVNDHPHEDDVSPPTTPPSSPPPVPTPAPTHPSAFSTPALRITAPPSASSSAPICQSFLLLHLHLLILLSVTIPVFPVDLVSKLPSRPTKADLMALVDHGFSPPADLLRLHDSDNVTIVPGPLPTFSADGVAAAPPLNILHDKTTNSYALQLHLGRCDPLSDGTPLPATVHYPKPPNPLRSHWIVDSGATCSCTPHIEYFTSYQPCSLSITVGDGATLPVKGYGPLSLNVTIQGNPLAIPPTSTTYAAITFSFGLHCPHLAFNLLSVRHAISDNYTISFPDRSMCHIRTPAKHTRVC
ncbi:hypothetical protein AeRB84_006947, partial [Aphanomyces euteiches]